MSIDQMLTQGQIASILLLIAIGVMLHLAWMVIRDTRDRNRQPR